MKMYRSGILQNPRRTIGILANPTTAGKYLSAGRLMDETVHMSCPSWEFPLWHRGNERVDGFLVFPATEEQNLELRLPYSQGQQRGILTYHFRKDKKVDIRSMEATR